ncbi:MAG: methyltransferase domain-containing protein [Candidatus Omnitrophica bacterium]|nr:methyltransferase domain-containing protein [Candidatus Omnitrophota bacterium]
MASNKWKKRIMKVKGFFRQAYSYALLRYTKWNTRRLQEDIVRRNVDKIHVGCGLVLLDGWLNILYEPRQEYGKVQKRGGKLLLNYNLLKKWPVSDNSISFIAGSHFIEHLDLNHGIRFLKESFRVLRPGGVIRLSCPDLEIYVRNYAERNMDFFENKLIREWCAFSQAQTPGEILAAKAYDSGGAHKWFYDFDSLKHVLEAAGFKDIKRCARLEGEVPELETLELPERELETVYMEAIKR